MKKQNKLGLLVAVVLIGATLTALSCRKAVEDTLEARCNNLLDEATDASSVFASNPSPATCQDYVEAMDNYVDGCRTYAGYQRAWEEYLESIDCSIYDY